MWGSLPASEIWGSPLLPGAVPYFGLWRWLVGCAFIFLGSDSYTVDRARRCFCCSCTAWGGIFGAREVAVGGKGKTERWGTW